MATFVTGTGRSIEDAFFLLKMPRSDWFKAAVAGALILMAQDFNWTENGDQTVNDAVEIANEMLESMEVIEVSPFPVGRVEAYAGGTTPEGWLPCDGASYAETDYPELFAAIGIVWGGGAGNFNVPNLMNLVVVGAGDEFSLADTGGEQDHTLIAAEMPGHNHVASGTSVSDLGHTHTEITAIPAVGSISPGVPFPYALPGAGLTGLASANLVVGDPTISDTGGDGAHNNMQPFAALNYIIYAGR